MGDYDEPTDSWWINEKLEDRLHQLSTEIIYAPHEHLYTWLREANPEVFKQWQAVYDIEQEN